MKFRVFLLVKILQNTQMGNQNSSAVNLHSCNPHDFDFKNLKPDIYLTQEEITRLQAIHRANIEYRRQSSR